MLVNEFVFKEELLRRVHQILRTYEENIELQDVILDVISTDSIPLILRDISREIDKLIKSDENVNFRMS